MKKITKVLVLEDQPEALSMLSRVLDRLLTGHEIDHIADLASLASVSPCDYDLFLVDLRLPDGLSCDYIKKFKSCCPDVPAIVTTLYADDDIVFSALSAGADGYLLKGDGEERLTLSLKRMLAGEPPISPSIARKLMRQFSTKTAENTPSNNQETESSQPNISDVLTPREIDVLTHIGKGQLAKQVAANLGISHHTVNDNIKAIYRKLGIKSRAEATLHATRSGLV